jgi:hypothetical protein
MLAHPEKDGDAREAYEECIIVKLQFYKVHPRETVTDLGDVLCVYLFPFFGMDHALVDLEKLTHVKPRQTVSWDSLYGSGSPPKKIDPTDRRSDIVDTYV